MNWLAILGIGFAIYYIIGIFVILIKAGPNETGAGGYGCGIAGWALIWPIILLM